MGWLNFGGKKRKQGQGFGKSQQRKSRKPRRTFVLEKIVTPSAGVGGWLQDFDALHQLLGSWPLPDLDLPNFLADSGVCPIDPSGVPTNNLPPLIDFDPLGLYHDGIATQTPYNPGGAFETLPVALIPVDPHSPNPNNPNAIRQLLNFPLASQPLVGSIDTGVSADSPYLNYANIKKGRDYVGGDDNPLLKAGEGSEHGTFMLGIVDAINKTAPKWVGRAIDSGRWADSLVEFVDAAKASGQKNAIANLSLDLTQKNADGSVTTRYELTPAERSAIEYARQNGVMLVVAAGNDGGVMSVLGQASQEFDNIFTVGAGDINGRSNYSSYGRGLDIVADGGTNEHPSLSTAGNDLGTMAGTSVATAKVAGAASLVWAANPALNYRQVMEILKSTARDLGPVGWDDETGFGFLNALAAVDLAKKTKPEVYKPTAWITPDTWSGQGKVTPEERAAKGGNSLAAATVQVSTNFSDSDRVDSNQPEKYYQFTVTEPGYVSWNLTSLNPVSGFPTPPQVTVTKADGKPGSYTFFKGPSIQTSVVGEGQTSFQGGNFYDPGTYYLKVGNGAGSTFNDYNISTQFIADLVSTFTGNIQYRTQPYFSLENSLQSAVFSGPAVSELSNLSGVVTYDNIQFNNRIAKYGMEVNESGKIRINLNSPNGKMEVSVNKFIGSDDRPVQLSGLVVSANSDGWLELDLNKGRYDIEVKTPSNYWQEPDWNSTQQRLVRPYTLNATFTPNAPQPGQGKVPSSAGAFDKTVASNGVVTHYYKNGYLTVQPSGQASWYSYGTGNAIGVIEISAVPLPFEIPPDYAGNSPNTARDIGTLIGTQTFHDVIDRNDRFDYYKFNITSESKVDFALSGKMGNTGFYLFQDWYFNSDDSTHIDIISGTPPNGVVPEFSQTLKPGSYYVLVHKPKDYDGDEYDLKLSATPLVDPDGNYSMPTAQNLLSGSGGADLGDGVNRELSQRIGILNSVGGQDLSDFYQASLNGVNLLNLQFTDIDNGANFELIQDLNGNGQLDSGEVIRTVSTRNSQGSLDEILPAGNYYLRVSPGSSDAKTQYVVNGEARSLENQVIASYYSDYYLVQNGQLRLIPNQETLNALNINQNTVKRFSNEDLALIPTGQGLPSRKDGSLLSINTGGKVYQMQSGKRRWIPDSETFNAMGLDWSNIKYLPIEDVDTVPLGEELPSRKDGSLLSINTGGKVYQMQSGKRRWIPDAETFNAMGLDWSNIKYLPIEDVDTVPLGEELPSRKDGTLLSINTGGKVYQMQSGKRRWIPDPETFNAMGLDWSNIKYLPIEDVDTVPLGEDLPSRKDEGSTNNRKPVITSFPNFEMPYGTSFILQTYANELQISDPDGDAIQFYEISVDPSRVDMEASTLEGQPLGKFIIPADQFNSIKFYGSVLGSNPVVIRAFDGKEWSDPKSFNLTVVPNTNTGGSGITPGNGGSASTIFPSPTSGSTQSVISALRTAIFGQESGYNYKAVNPNSGALGIAQVMPANIPSWSREALGYEITDNQFLNNPDLQLKIIDYKLNQYYQQAIAASGGNVDIAVRRVASAWYSGNPNNYNDTSPQYTNGVQYPSIANYTLSVLGKFRQAYGGGSSGNTGSPGGSNLGDSEISLLQTVNTQYFLARPQIYITLNPPQNQILTLNEKKVRSLKSQIDDAAKELNISKALLGSIVLDELNRRSSEDDIQNFLAGLDSQKAYEDNYSIGISQIKPRTAVEVFENVFNFSPTISYLIKSLLDDSQSVRIAAGRIKQIVDTWKVKYPKASDLSNGSDGSKLVGTLYSIGLGNPKENPSFNERGEQIAMQMSRVERILTYSDENQINFV